MTDTFEPLPPAPGSPLNGRKSFITDNQIMKLKDGKHILLTTPNGLLNKSRNKALTRLGWGDLRGPMREFDRADTVTVSDGKRVRIMKDRQMELTMGRDADGLVAQSDISTYFTKLMDANPGPRPGDYLPRANKCFCGGNGWVMLVGTGAPNRKIACPDCAANS